MTKKNIKNSMLFTCKRGWRERYCPHNRDGVEEIYGGDEILECSIKPEPKYRPFKNAEECWTEMQKHQPFGWLKRKDSNEYNLLTSVDGSVECEGVRIDSDGFGWDRANDEYTFADGTPFGIKYEQ